MNWPPGVGRIILDEVDSTLSEAQRRFSSLSGPTWILARRQTAGRGRRGRAWQMPKGNFAATLVMRQDDPATGALRSFVAALALADAVEGVLGRADGITLKWPNDVLLGGGKLAGILLEGIGQGGRIDGLAIGIGVNLVATPAEESLEPGALRPVSLAGHAGVTVPPEDFLDLLAPAFAAWDGRLSTFGFAPIRQAWLSRAAKLGQEITARLPAEEITGTFETVDEDGQLVLTTPHGRRRIAAADIYF